MPSYTYFSVSRDGDSIWALQSTPLPGQPFIVLDCAFREEIFPNIQPKPALAQLESISSHPGPWEKKSTLTWLHPPFRSWRVIRSPSSLLFPRLNTFSSLSFSSSGLCSRPIPGLSLSGLAPALQCPSSYEWPGTGHRSRGVASAVPNTEGQSLPWSCCHTIAGTGQVPSPFLAHTHQGCACIFKYWGPRLRVVKWSKP